METTHVVELTERERFIIHEIGMYAKSAEEAADNAIALLLQDFLYQFSWISADIITHKTRAIFWNNASEQLSRIGEATPTGRITLKLVIEELRREANQIFETSAVNTGGSGNPLREYTNTTNTKVYIRIRETLDRYLRTL
jgi:hypothetical protein